MKPLKMNYSEIAYLQRANKVHIDNVVKVDIDKKYTVKCNGVKQSSFAKKNRVRLNENIESRFMLEAQKNTSTRLTDKKNKFLENKRLSKAK